METRHEASRVERHTGSPAAATGPRVLEAEYRHRSPGTMSVESLDTDRKEQAGRQKMRASGGTLLGVC